MVADKTSSTLFTELTAIAITLPYSRPPNLSFISVDIGGKLIIVTFNYEFVDPSAFDTQPKSPKLNY